MTRSISAIAALLLAFAETCTTLTAPGGEPNPGAPPGHVDSHAHGALITLLSVSSEFDAGCSRDDKIQFAADARSFWERAERRLNPDDSSLERKQIEIRVLRCRRRELIVRGEKLKATQVEGELQRKIEGLKLAFDKLYALNAISASQLKVEKRLVECETLDLKRLAWALTDKIKP